MKAFAKPFDAWCAAVILGSLLPLDVAAADFRIRDPFVLVDREKGEYCLYGVEHYGGDKRTGPTGVWVRKSADLKNWSAPQRVMTAPDWTYLVWAPEVHRYAGKYYMFATLKEFHDPKRPIKFMSSDPNWTHGAEGRSWDSWHATWIYRADTPEGPFLPISEKSATPAGWVALDGTLWVEDGKPYMVFTHDWFQTMVGTIELQPMSEDLTQAVGKPVTLFTAATVDPNTRKGVTDGPFVCRSEKSGKLFITWSTHNPAKVHDGGYCVVLAESLSGRIAGPWGRQRIIYDRNGGHGMMFRDLRGNLRFALHHPERWGDERLTLFAVDDLGET